MIKPDETIVSDHYVVTRYHRDPSRLIIAFASAGQWGAGEPLEEFRNTLLRTGTSCIFVLCQGIEWYNHPETRNLLEMLATVAEEYQFCGAIGESMGGSGTLMFGASTPHVTRLLCFAPQFSVVPPFIDFDIRYREIGNAVTRHYWSDFAFEGISHKSTLLFGTGDITESVHAAMFMYSGFSVHWIPGSGHEVARFLKMSPSGNHLQKLVDAFCNFDRPFDKDVLVHTIGQFLTFSPPMGLLAAYARPDSRCPVPGADLALRQRATQSSVSRWSVGTCEEDASRAVSAFFNPRFSFHTEFEQDPWWELDLGGVCAVSEVRIHDRVDVPTQFEDLFIDLSIDRGRWSGVFANGTPGPLGENRIVVTVSPAVDAQFVRVIAKGKTCLHLAKVQVFGSRLT